MEAKKKPKEAKDKKLKTKWIYVLTNDSEGNVYVGGKKRVPINYQSDAAKGEYDKYTDGARDAAVALITKQMDALRDFRRKVYLMPAKKLEVLE